MQEIRACRRLRRTRMDERNDGRPRLKTSPAGTFGLDFVLIPALLLPLAIVLAPTPYLSVVPALYLVLTIAVDEGVGRGKALPSLAGIRLGDFWLRLFGVNLLCFLLVAFATIDP